MVKKKEAVQVSSIAHKYIEAKDISGNRLNLVACLAALVVLLIGFLVNRLIENDWLTFNIPIVVLTIFLGVYVLFALRIAKQWERAVVLRLGKFSRLKGPGVFFIIPVIESVVQVVDMRI